VPWDTGDAEGKTCFIFPIRKLIKDFRAAQVEWQMEVYSGAEHGFSTPKNTAEQRANTLSQAAMARFFSEIFGN
jgi:dienelactone hydrolase